MRVGIIQSNYIPWRGYFDFIDSVDLFIIFDDVKYPRGRSWRNRNKLKFSNGLRWLSVPVNSKSHNLSIDNVMIANKTKFWKITHCRLIKEALAPTPFFDDTLAIWKEGVSSNDATISQINIQLIRIICDYLKINTPIVMARDLDVKGAKTERLINLLKKVGATVYLSGSTAKGYLDENLFRENNISLEYKTYNYKPYPQLWGSFEGAVSVLDLIANTGLEAKHFLKSQTPNVIAVK